MKKIFNADQIRQIDRCTIQNQGITSLDLMERASLAVYEIIKGKLDPSKSIFVFAGSGNNGGDGLAVARMLTMNNFNLRVYMVATSGNLSHDCSVNKERLKKLITVSEIKNEDDIPSISPGSIVIDALLGVGVNRPIEGLNKILVKRINESNSIVYSIDMPSGLFVENNSENEPNTVIKAHEILTFQAPKLSMLLPDNNSFHKISTIVNIELCDKCINEESSDYYWIEESDVSALVKSRNRFSHKGNYGRAFIVSGMEGKIGASILTAKACLRTGVGLLTMHVPLCGLNVLQTSIPESMVDPDRNEHHVTQVDFDLSNQTLGIGPGMGVERESAELLKNLLSKATKPVVLDADALNIIAQNETMARLIPQNSILTPHPVEFDRLVAQDFSTAYERLQSARDFAKRLNIFIVLKGAYSATITPTREVFFNSTGNPGMATGGSGDVLTGMITSLLAQGYLPKDAAILANYLHGLAGDLAIKLTSEESLIASDIISHIGKAFKIIKK